MTLTTGFLSLRQWLCTKNSVLLSPIGFMSGARSPHMRFGPSFHGCAYSSPPMQDDQGRQLRPPRPPRSIRVNSPPDFGQADVIIPTRAVVRQLQPPLSWNDYTSSPSRVRSPYPRMADRLFRFIHSRQTRSQSIWPHTAIVPYVAAEAVGSLFSVLSKTAPLMRRSLERRRERRHCR